MPDDPQKDELPRDDAPTAAIRPSKRLSIVWLVPLVALAISGWLLYKSWSEKGPLITITFKNAERISEGASKIKYKDVDIGEVETITFSPDMKQVVVKARIDKVAEPHLTDNTSFWIVRPRITAGKISGLGTLLSGSYISMEPGHPGTQRRNFTGLEEAPFITTDNPGKYYILKAEGLGSLDIGSPVSYRQIKVGQVVGYGFDDSGQAVHIRIFVNAPHDQQISTNTSFWNASGFELNLDATGIKLDTESLTSILSGGISFDLPPQGRPGTIAKENTTFELFSSRKAVNEIKYHLTDTWQVYFNQSVRGLTVGAPVEFQGIKIGEVSSINLKFESITMSFRTPVMLRIEPERIFGQDPDFNTTDGQAILNTFITRGMRAVLKNGNLLTGQLLIDFDFYPNQPAQKITYEDAIPVLPTRQTELQLLTDSLSTILNKVEKIPFQQISEDLHALLKTTNTAIAQIPVQSLGEDLRATLKAANTTMTHINTMAETVNTQTTPAITAALEQLRTTLADMEHSLGSDSPTNHQLRQTMRDISTAVRSLRSLSDYLDRHPESIIHGKEDEMP
ncbi:MAG: MCE family protein [Proteobacteria bacterium]|nr:MCE family protein [Desulfobulbaceae bacterium]MBU4151382.1 MCE family protein [Pseudomonadota bacterium]